MIPPRPRISITPTISIYVFYYPAYSIKTSICHSNPFIIPCIMLFINYFLCFFETTLDFIKEPFTFLLITFLLITFIQDIENMQREIYLNYICTLMRSKFTLIKQAKIHTSGIVIF